MKKISRRKIWKWVMAIVFTYFALGIALYFLQDRFLFHPEKLPTDYRFQFDIPFSEINLLVNEKKNLSIVRFTVPDSARRGIVIYFHGNRRNIVRYAHFATNFTHLGYEVWMMDYPGFGKSTGKRTESVIYQDALRVYQMVINQVAADSIILYGKSMGSGIAAQLASVRDCRRLILETPYYSIAALARQHLFMYPFMPFAKYEIPTSEYLENVRAPVTIFHGTSDRTISYDQAIMLAREHPAVELITIQKGGHNDLNDFPLFHQRLDSLLQIPFPGRHTK